MQADDSTPKRINWLRRWIGALSAGAPAGMEHVATDHVQQRLAAGTTEAEALLEPLGRLLDEARHQAPTYQVPASGVGTLYHRDYRVTFETDASAESIILAMTLDLNRFTNPVLALFRKSRGETDEFRVGDRYDILITGPWDGPVEVVDTRPGQFTFITLKGHLEAGFITFEAAERGNGRVEFAIRSWATCSTRLVWFSYAVLGLSKYMQTQMWRFFCLRVAQEFGKDCSQLAVRTYRIPRDPA
jgi:hypothetical protein